MKTVGLLLLIHSTEGFLNVPDSQIHSFATKKSQVIQRVPKHKITTQTPLTLLKMSQTPFQVTIASNRYPTASLAVLIGYHVQLFLRERKGGKSWRKEQADMRERWSAYVRETEGWLYAVQTLRNAITANTFLATTVLSLLTLIAGRIWDILRKSPTSSTLGQDRLVFQLVSISTCMLASAYEFLQSARLMTHAGFMFPVASGNKVDGIVRKSQNAQWKGLRCLYLSIGAVAWTLGGDRFFFIISLLLVSFLNRVDKPPIDKE